MRCRGRITKALENRLYRDALPSFRKLAERNKELPESFDYYFIESLASAGEKDEARRMMDAYLAKYGSKGRYYQRVIDLRARMF